MKRVAWILMLVLGYLTLEGNFARAETPLDVGRWLNSASAELGFAPNTYFRTIAIDSQARLWVGTENQGIALFDGATWTRYTQADGLVDDRIERITATGDSVWIATRGGVSHFLPPNNWTNYTTSNGINGNDLPSNNISAIARRSSPIVGLSTYLFATTGNGIADCALFGDPDDLNCAYFTEANSDLISNFVYDLESTADGDAWIASSGGVNHLVGSTITAHTPATAPGCPQIDQASDIAVDASRGRVWVALANGIYNIDGRPGEGACLYEIATDTWHHFHEDNSGLADNTVFDLAIDSEGRSWFATSPYNNVTPGGVYLCTWINGTCYWEEYGTGDGLASKRVSAVATNLERIWFGTADAGISTFAPRWQRLSTETQNIEAQALLDTGEALWVGRANELSRMSYPSVSWTQQIPNVNVQALLAITSTNSSDLWAATLDKGLWHWNGSAWEQFETGNSEIASDALLALAHDQSGRIWVGTEAAGVLVYDPVADAWSQFTGAPFLPANRVQSLAVGSGGDIWLGTNNGLAHYTGSTWETIANASLPGTNILSLAVNAAGDLWVGTATGVARWNGTTWTTFTPVNSELYNGRASALLIGTDDRVWIGTEAGASLYNGTSWTTYRGLNSGLLNERVRAMALNPEGHIWFGGVAYTQTIAYAGNITLRSNSTEPLGQPAPTITSFAPASALVQSIITINGAHFAPENIVEFSGASGWASAEILTRSDSSLTVRVPVSALYGPIRVRNGSSTGTSATSFGPLPQISSFTPANQIVSGEVEIRGSSLASPGFTEVRFGDSAWSSLAVLEERPGLLRVRVPADATNGPIRVRTPAGEASSTTNFARGAGGFKIFGYEVHQGLPQYPLVAGKNTVVRVFVGTDNPNGLCAYADQAVLQILSGADEWAYLANLANGGIANSGEFCNSTQQVSKDGSIDFVIPGEILEANRTYFMGVGASMRFINHPARNLGIYRFSATDDIRIHASIPAWSNDTTQRMALDNSMSTQARTYPVRDGWGSIGGDQGMQITMRNYPVCDGTATAFCGAGYVWDAWQQNPAGQVRVCTIENTLANGNDDGSILTFNPGTLSEGSEDSRVFHARVRPGQTIPADPRALLNVTANNGIQITLESSGSLNTSRCGTTTIAGVIRYVVRFRNTTTSNLQPQINIDYDQTRLALYGSGGIMAGNGNTFTTQTKPGLFWMGGGWLPSRHDAPVDENYNGVIDASDMAFFVIEMEDWNSTTGGFSRSTDLTLVGPGDLIRSFNDANRNNQHDNGETRSQFVQRGDNVQKLLWNIPHAYMTDYNATAMLDADFSGLLFMPGINAFMGPGQGRCFDGCTKPGYQFWTNVSNTTVFGQELGHSLGMVHKDSPNNDGGTHTLNPRISYVPAGYNTTARTVVLGPEMKSIMHGIEQSPAQESFFEPFEYSQVFWYLRAQLNQQQATIASPNSPNIGETFYLAGTVTGEHEATLDHSYVAQGLPLTAASPLSEYVLRFMNGTIALAEHRFPVDYEAFDHDHHADVVETPLATFAIVQPFPLTTTGIEIWHGSHLLLERAVSASAPVVQVTAPSGGENVAANGTLTIEWQATDANGDTLHYTVRYSPDNGTTWTTLAVAIMGKQLSVPANTLPGSTTALIEVVATDGFNTGIDRSNAPFQMGNKPPQGVGFSSPIAGAELLYGVPTYLVGNAFDLEDGMLPDSALAWRSDRDGDLGTGNNISTMLTVGTHTLSLTATDSDNAQATATAQVTILPDFDSDGLSDLYEQAQTVLNWWDPTDAGVDSDGDGLNNRSEAAWGTDPSNADSDQDGVNDGAEAAAGSSPTDPTSTPVSLQLLISREEFNYTVVAGEGSTEGSNREINEMIFLMSSTSQTLTWSVAENIPWLSITPESGATAGNSTVGEATLKIDLNQLKPGVHVGIVTFVATGAATRTLAVRVEVVEPPTIEFPLRMPRVQHESNTLR
jgi:ligand-binding sensor domain-containing protein